MPAQHQNLRAVFDQSWALLTPAEQRLLQALTIFQGSFTRSAAAEVAEATLPLLSGLIDKSLLRRLGPDRYSLHELIRQYAAERLHADRAVYQEVGAKHGRFFLHWLAESEASLFSHLRGPVFEQLTASVGDLRAAWQWGLAQQQWDLLLRAARTYPTFYELHSWNQEGLRLLIETTERLQPFARVESADPAVRLLFGAMMGSRGWFHFRCGQMAEARAALDEGLAHIRASGPHTERERCLQFALFQLGMVAYISGDYATAQNALDEGLAISRRLSDDWGTAYTLAILGMVRLAHGQAAQAYELLSQSLTTWRRNGSPRLGVFCFSFFGIVARAVGKHEEAESALQEGLTLAQHAGDRYGVATFLHSLGALKLAQAAYEAAETAVQDSLIIFHRTGRPLAHHPGAGVSWPPFTRRRGPGPCGTGFSGRLCYSRRRPRPALCPGSAGRPGRPLCPNGAKSGRFSPGAAGAEPSGQQRPGSGPRRQVGGAVGAGGGGGNGRCAVCG
jgi:tetratricopeptide (TPR) repeat protein